MIINSGIIARQSQKVKRRKCLGGAAIAIFGERSAVEPA
jgi:hypothetical protein